MNKAFHTAKNIVHKSLPGHLMREQRTRRSVKQFADRLGFVYFGFVNQRDDEHRLLRGITTSKSHTDHHYTVGTFDSYDIALTVRRDTLEYPDRRLKDHFWTILTVDLHTTHDMPPFYLTHQRAKEQLLARYTQMTPLITGTQAPTGNDFSTTYTVYANMTQAIEVQQLINQHLSQGIMTYFKDMSIELVDDTLYLYAPEKHPSKQLLERMLMNGVWLAKTIDTVAPTIYQ
jgi:hypothetical protein